MKTVESGTRKSSSNLAKIKGRKSGVISKKDMSRCKSEQERCKSEQRRFNRGAQLVAPLTHEEGID